jgi:hypothetical protein
LWRRVAPKWCRSDTRTPFFEEDKDGKGNYEGSVRRFRMDLPDEVDAAAGGGGGAGGAGKQSSSRPASANLNFKSKFKAPTIKGRLRQQQQHSGRTGDR